MGCGCPERKERIVKKAEQHGWDRLAGLIRTIPSPGGEKPTRKPERSSTARGWTAADLPGSGKTSIGGADKGGQGGA